MAERLLLDEGVKALHVLDAGAAQQAPVQVLAADGELCARPSPARKGAALQGVPEVATVVRRHEVQRLGEDRVRGRDERRVAALLRLELLHQREAVAHGRGARYRRRRRIPRTAAATAAVAATAILIVTATATATTITFLVFSLDEADRVEDVVVGEGEDGGGGTVGAVGVDAHVVLEPVGHLHRHG